MVSSTRVTGILNQGTSLEDGKYKITKLLGKGGFGITYKCLDTKLNRSVALKEFFPQGCLREGTTVVSAGRWSNSKYTNAKHKFLQEGRNLGKFNHPGIVKVFYYFEENNTAYMVMEYLRGRTLGKILKMQGGKLNQKQALYFIEKVGQALAVLHEANFLHRDIKPENIIMAEDGRIVLIDFGAARDISNNNSKGFTAMLTPGYAPLEQYGQSLPYGTFTDIYALGATLYRLLTGKVPTSAVERAAGVKLPCISEINPDVSGHIIKAVMKAMAIDASERLQSVTAFLRMLQLYSYKLSNNTSTHKFYETFSDPWKAFEKNSDKGQLNYQSPTQSWF